jgi:hypothetical protein
VRKTEIVSEIPEVVYVAGGGDVDEAVRLGAAWLREHPGDKLVLVPQMQVYRNNALLPELTAGAKVARPRTVWQVNWLGGPVLAPWPTSEVEVVPSSVELRWRPVIFMLLSGPHFGLRY